MTVMPPPFELEDEDYEVEDEDFDEVEVKLEVNIEELVPLFNKLDKVESLFEFPVLKLILPP
jgi:hypothetical protein